MCVQKFVYYRCGHSQIFALNCNHSAELPFALTVSCPSYESGRFTPNVGCGLGKYYCSKTKDGPFLDHVHTTYETVESWMLKIDLELSKIIAAANNFADNASRIHFPRHAWLYDPLYRKITAAYHSLVNKRRGMEVTKVEAGQIIVDAMKYFCQARRGRNDTDNHVSLPPLLNIPDWAQLQRRPTSDGLPSPTVPKSEGIPQACTGAPVETPEGLNRHAPHNSANLSHQRKASFDRIPAEISERAKHPLSESQRQLPGTDAQSVPESAQKQIRRSGRMRKKVVKYAESSGSSLPSSRSASPEKSDTAYVTESSPKKFANARSSTKRSYTGPGNRNLLQENPENQRTIKDMLSEWGIRMNSKSPTPPTDMMAKPKKSLSRQANIESEKDSNPAVDSPKTIASRSGDELHSHRDLDTAQRKSMLHDRLTHQLHQEIRSHEQSTSLTPNWSPPKHRTAIETLPYTSPENMGQLANISSANTATAGDPAGGRYDSVDETTHPAPCVGNSANYQDMRNSSHTTPNLTKRKQVEVVKEANEPNKRKSLANHAAIPVKRICLSLPEDKNTSDLLSSRDAHLISPRMVPPVTDDSDVQNSSRYQGQRKEERHQAMPLAPMLRPNVIRNKQDSLQDEVLLQGGDCGAGMDFGTEADE